MSFRLFFFCSLAAWALLGCDPSAQDKNNRAAKPRHSQRPNILLAISDGQTFRHLGLFSSWLKTPTIDSLATEGVLFAQAYSASPSSSPSRAALLTGKNCWQLEQAGTHASHFPTKFETFPYQLREAGYTIGRIGKGWAPGQFKKTGWSQNPAGPEPFRVRKDSAPEGIRPVDYGASFSQFLDSIPKDRPFFYWYGAYEPHRPYGWGNGLEYGIDTSLIQVPDYLPDTDSVRQDLANYAYEITYFDYYLGRMLQNLRKRGRLENTLILVTSDNGMPFPRAKANCYEDGLHVPLVAHWSGQNLPARVDSGLVSLIDLAPTILQAAGAETAPLNRPKKMAGKSFLDRLEGPFSGRRAVYSARERHSSSRWHNAGYPQRSMRTDSFLLIWNQRPQRMPAGAPKKYQIGENGDTSLATAYHDIDSGPTKSVLLKAVAQGAQKYHHLNLAKRPEWELYRPQEDPYCLHNLADSAAYQLHKKRLALQLKNYLKKTSDPRKGPQPEIFESYPRVRGPMRRYPEPQWAETFRKHTQAGGQ